MAQHEVIVGNIGKVYDGKLPIEARSIYFHYVKESKSGKGRAGDETVTWLKDGEIKKEHFGKTEMYYEGD